MTDQFDHPIRYYTYDKFNKRKNKTLVFNNLE